MAKNRPERRKKQRIQLTRGLLARYGTTGAVILDITDLGARIEHFVFLEVGKRASFRFEWLGKLIETVAQVRSCKVHRFAHGEAGTTVYQSGLMFVEYVGESQALLREMVATIVARSLAEQVANARGIGPVIEKNMPVFRAGAVAGSGLDATPAKKGKWLPDSEMVVDRGYIRCSLINNRFEKKWSRTSDQPVEGFTVRATEAPEHIDQLCETYLKGNEHDRKLIRLLALLSVEKQEETPEPVSE